MVKLGMGGSWLLVMVHMTCDTHICELSLKLHGPYLLQFGNEDFEEKYKILNKESHPKLDGVAPLITDEAPPIVKTNAFSKIAVTFEPLMGF